jgi:hypothetical protein
MEKNFLCDILTAESSMATSGAFEASVVLVAWERCHAKKHQTLTGFPCVICENEVRLEFLGVSETPTPIVSQNPILSRIEQHLTARR